MKPNIPEKSQHLEQIGVTYKRIACQADHPRVYYNLNNDGYVVCLYCNKMFVATESTDFKNEGVYVHTDE